MEASSNPPAFLFDLDGTLVDSVYQHVLAWREALERSGIELAVWRIHRRIGMSGGLLVNALLRETGHPVTSEQAKQLPRFHAEAYGRMVAQVRPLPGVNELPKRRRKAPALQGWGYKAYLDEAAGAADATACS